MFRVDYLSKKGKLGGDKRKITFMSGEGDQMVMKVSGIINKDATISIGRGLPNTSSNIITDNLLTFRHLFCSGPTIKNNNNNQRKSKKPVQEDIYDTLEDVPDPVHQAPRGPPRGPAPSQQPHSRPKVDLKKIRQNSAPKVTF